ncbi:hypothetical protein [Sphingobium sp. TomTYG45]
MPAPASATLDRRGQFDRARAADSRAHELDTGGRDLLGRELDGSRRRRLCAFLGFGFGLFPGRLAAAAGGERGNERERQHRAQDVRVHRVNLS